MHCVAPASVSYRSFNSDTDFAWLHKLWHRAMHHRWSISPEAMQQILSGADLQLVADHEGVPIGFCAVGSKEQGSAALIVVLVEPDKQRCGVGTELLRTIESKLKGRGIHEVSLGAGGDQYFWPGLPEEQQGARHFFMKHDFEVRETSEDLVQELGNYETPAWIVDRQLATETTLHLAKPAWSNQISAFETRHFPVWAPFFQNELRQGGFQNILTALGPDGCIRGTLLMRRDASVLWQEAQGTRAGTLNTLGVAPEHQGRGIGLALTAGAMEHLRSSGCSRCYIQWTGLADWYGKLGAKSWARYHMAAKLL